MDNGLDPDERAALVATLRRMELIGAQEEPALSPLSGGVSSQIVRADTARGAVCIKRALAKLRVAAQWSAPPERNAAEVAWIRLASRLVPGAVPEVLAQDWQTQTFAMTFFDPAEYSVWKHDLRDGRVDVSIARSVGARLAAIHHGTSRNGDVERTFATDANFFACVSSLTFSRARTSTRIAQWRCAR